MTEVLETILGIITFISAIGFLFLIILFFPKINNYVNASSFKNYRYAEIGDKIYCLKKVYVLDMNLNCFCLEVFNFIIDFNNVDFNNEGIDNRIFKLKDIKTSKIFVYGNKVKLYENVDFIAEEWYKVQQENKKEGEKN
jgi:hypothetical protein